MEKVSRVLVFENYTEKAKFSVTASEFKGC